YAVGTRTPVRESPLRGRLRLCGGTTVWRRATSPDRAERSSADSAQCPPPAAGTKSEIQRRAGRSNLDRTGRRASRTDHYRPQYRWENGCPENDGPARTDGPGWTPHSRRPRG